MPVDTLVSSLVITQFVHSELQAYRRMEEFTEDEALTEWSAGDVNYLYLDKLQDQQPTDLKDIIVHIPISTQHALLYTSNHGHQQQVRIKQRSVPMMHIQSRSIRSHAYVKSK